jgi:hypothetical protein
MSSDIAQTFRGMIAAGGTATERDLLAVVGDLTRVSISAATERERLAVAADMVSGATALGSSTPSVSSEDLKRWICDDRTAGNAYEGPAAWLETARLVLGHDLGPTCQPALIEIAEQLIAEYAQRYGATL